MLEKIFPVLVASFIAIQIYLSIVGFFRFVSEGNIAYFFAAIVTLVFAAYNFYMLRMFFDERL